MATPFANVNIPPLQSGERIAYWEKLFRPAVTPLFALENGDKLAVELLPAYVCKNSRERTRERHRQRRYEPDGRFRSLLIANLDPPVDPQLFAAKSEIPRNS